jgi:hypothetical protein
MQLALAIVILGCLFAAMAWAADNDITNRK